jgi:putative FmdB family regulatory protein
MPGSEASTMPYYDYHCSACGKQFEEMQSFEEHDRHETHERHEQLRCPECGSSELKPVLAASVTVITAKKS